MRELTIDGWGKAVLEELLFQAASQLSDGADCREAGGEVRITLTCQLRADVERGCITVEVPSLVDGSLVTSLIHPF